MRVVLIVEYEGTRYHGFQYQKNASSIQEELERALARLTGEKTRVAGAGRTDAGVHATGQVVAFDTDVGHSTETIVAALNSHLPEDIAVKAAHRVVSDFDPRRHALSRRYRYTVHCGPTPSPLTRRTAYYVRGGLDTERMRRAAGLFIGAHDFARFAGPLSVPGASTVREVYGADVRQEGDIICIEVEGNAFLPHQVRRMAGALVSVGRGTLALAGLESMIDHGTGDAVAESLPPHGLCLLKVTYDRSL